MNKVRVLLVEDDEDDYVLTQSLLSEIDEEKFMLEWVTDYDSAMDRISHRDYDICLLDYRLGVHTGLDLLRAMLSQGYSGPIILLTGQSDQEIDVEAMKAGAADYLIKGQINASLLERSIRYALEHKRIEEERVQHIREQEARLQAEAANKVKDEFLAMVSHELRTPLNALLGWVRVLRLNQNNEKMITPALDAIERSAKLQSQLVEDLLDISRIDNGNLRLERQPVDLISVIKPAVDSLHPSADAKVLRLELFDDNSPKVISGDPARLHQIINNLILNAIKFTPEGGRIEVKLENSGTDAKIMVKDTGKGISSDFLPYIFDRYRQAEDAKSDRLGGLGLGLAIVKYLIEQHQGTISAESEGEDQGTTFTILLPLKL